MEEGVPKYDEHCRRKDRKFGGVHVMINPDDSLEVYCTKKVESLGVDECTAVTYASMSEAPEIVQQHIALLRMSDNSTFVPEIGTRVNERIYWLELPN
jgi:hypothetical protein